MLKDLEERINMLKDLDNMYKQLGNLNRYENSKREPNGNTKKKKNKTISKLENSFDRIISALKTDQWFIQAEIKRIKKGFKKKGGGDPTTVGRYQMV